jgi:hypothetical protein
MARNLHISSVEATKPKVRIGGSDYASVQSPPLRSAGWFRAAQARSQQRPYGLRAIGLTGAKSKLINRIHLSGTQEDLQAMAAFSGRLRLLPWHGTFRLVDQRPQREVTRAA